VEWFTGIWGSGAGKYDFLKLRSQKGFIPSWLGGNSFKQFQFQQHKTLNNKRKHATKTMTTFFLNR
jgi:hypothetical protein